jgi:hypothetical protein
VLIQPIWHGPQALTTTAAWGFTRFSSSPIRLLDALQGVLRDPLEQAVQQAPRDYGQKHSDRKEKPLGLRAPRVRSFRLRFGVVLLVSLHATHIRKRPPLSGIARLSPAIVHAGRGRSF